jgi:hypothetical protein
MLLIVLLSDCKIFPPSVGKANRSNVFATGPVVRSRVGEVAAISDLPAQQPKVQGERHSVS